MICSRVTLPERIATWPASKPRATNAFFVSSASDPICSGASLATRPTTMSAAGPGDMGISTVAAAPAGGGFEDIWASPKVVAAAARMTAIDTANFNLTQAIAFNTPRMMALVEGDAARPAQEDDARATTDAGAALTECVEMAVAMTAALNVKPRRTNRPRNFSRAR